MLEENRVYSFQSKVMAPLKKQENRRWIQPHNRQRNQILKFLPQQKNVVSKHQQDLQNSNTKVKSCYRKIIDRIMKKIVVLLNKNKKMHLSLENLKQIVS